MSYSDCPTITRLFSLFHIPTCFGRGWRHGPWNRKSRLGLCNNATPCSQPRDVEQEKHCCLPTQTSANKHNTCINSTPMSCGIYLQCYLWPLFSILQVSSDSIRVIDAKTNSGVRLMICWMGSIGMDKTVALKSQQMLTPWGRAMHIYEPMY